MVNVSLLDKMLKNSTIDFTDVMENSVLFTSKEGWTTSIPALNIALTGEIDGEFNPGMLAIAGPSKHFKSLFALLIAKAYLDKHKDGVMLLYDSEFGAPLHYFQSVGIDTKRVVHTPVTTVEELRHDCVNQLKELTRGDKVIIVIDSIGNLASNKEVADAESGNQAADMTRAKALKSFGRIVTPHLSLKSIPMIVINHTYEELALFPKQIMSGGTGIYYSSNDIWFIGRQQEKDGTEVVGYNFIINIEKSRKVKEKSKIPINVTYEGGINKWSGLLDIALNNGFVTSEKKGWYQNKITGQNCRKDQTNTDGFWQPIIDNQEFLEMVKQQYSQGQAGLITDNAND